MSAICCLRPAEHISGVDKTGPFNVVQDSAEFVRTQLRAGPEVTRKVQSRAAL